MEKTMMVKTSSKRSQPIIPLKQADLQQEGDTLQLRRLYKGSTQRELTRRVQAIMMEKNKDSKEEVGMNDADLRLLSKEEKGHGKRSFSNRTSRDRKIRVMHGKLIPETPANTEEEVAFSMLRVNPDHFEATKDKYRKYNIKPQQPGPRAVWDFKKIWRVLNLQQVLREQEMALPNRDGMKYFESHRKMQQHLQDNHSMRPKTTASNYRTKMQYINYLNQFNP